MLDTVTYRPTERETADALFLPAVWEPALEKYAAVTHLTVALYDAQGRLGCGPINESGMFAFFTGHQYDPGLFADCVNRCLRETEGRPAVVVADRAGLAAVGAPLVLNGATVGVAVAGYSLVEFPQSMPIERMAREGGSRSISSGTSSGVRRRCHDSDSLSRASFCRCSATHCSLKTTGPANTKKPLFNCGPRSAQKTSSWP